MKMEHWIDLTVMIDEEYLPYPGDDIWTFEQSKKRKSDGYDLKRISINMHVGTHLDAKKHVLDSEEGIEAIDINRMIGRALVIRPSINDGMISSEDISAQYEEGFDILLIETGHARYFLSEEYYHQPKFERGICDFLAAKGIKVLGMDMASPEYRDGDFLDMHRDLMNRDVVIIENLTNLDQLQKQVDFIGLPLKIKGLDGSLLRCVAKNIVKD